MTEYVNGWLTNLSKYIASMNTELMKIKAQNAKLRRELDLTKRMYAKVSEEKCVADSENAKLRELLCDVHEALRADKAGMFRKLTLASMEDDMRELGVEVDG